MMFRLLVASDFICYEILEQTEFHSSFSDEIQFEGLCFCLYQFCVY